MWIDITQHRSPATIPAQHHANHYLHKPTSDSIRLVVVLAGDMTWSDTYLPTTGTVHVMLITGAFSKSGKAQHRWLFVRDGGAALVGAV